MDEARLPRGFRDFPPEIMILRKEVMNRIENLFQRYGFDPMETTSIELWETVKGKLGHEAENKLMFVFPDFFSKEWLALRYDLTMSLARYVATHQDIPLPFKRYQIGRVWRHEEPQRGRYREFWQCDADTVGSGHPEADAELILLIADVMDMFGLRRFTVKLNDRGLLAAIFERELDVRNPLPVYRAIDKLDKIGWQEVRRELEALGMSESMVDRIGELISSSGSEDVLDILRRRFGSEQIEEAAARLEEILSIVNDDRVRIDLSLVRGLDYYTGPIFELAIERPRIGSLAGGGRYDKLVGKYGGRDVPATGVSIGVERLIDACLELGILELSKRSLSDVYVVSVGESSRPYAWRVASVLRKGGLNVSVDLMRRSHLMQRKHAKKLGVRILAFVGIKEMSSESVSLYDTETSERIVCSFSEVVDEVRKMVRR